MRQSIKHQVVKCSKCGTVYIPYVEGDEKECDYCIAENELIGQENDSRLDEVPELYKE